MIPVYKRGKNDILPHKHLKDPIRYPKIQCGYEQLAQAIFMTQTGNMVKDIVKEMSSSIK